MIIAHPVGIPKCHATSPQNLEAETRRWCKMVENVLPQLIKPPLCFRILLQPLVGVFTNQRLKQEALLIWPQLNPTQFKGLVEFLDHLSEKEMKMIRQYVLTYKRLLKIVRF